MNAVQGSSHAIGWEEASAFVNSLAPLMDSMTARRAEVTVSNPFHRDAELFRFRSSWRVGHSSNRRLSEVHARGVAPLPDVLAPRRSAWAAGGQRKLDSFAGRQAPSWTASTGIEVTGEADELARALGVRKDANVVLRLAQRFVPGAEHAEMTVVRDFEDGATGLHVTVRTAASPAEVVDAEDGLHEALFDRLTPASRSLFSIGYEFVARQWTHWTS